MEGTIELPHQSRLELQKRVMVNKPIKKDLHEKLHENELPKTTILHSKDTREIFEVRTLHLLPYHSRIYYLVKAKLILKSLKMIPNFL